MATKRRKSVSDVRNQFDRIWTEGVKNSDAYKSLSDEKDDVIRFQQADKMLRSNRGLSSKDQRINDRINRADRIGQRYRDNILQGSGFSDSTPYLERNPERLKAYSKYADKKFGYAKRMGMANSNG